MSEFDDERARGREAILKRRAKLVAYAVAAGVAMPACGGKSNYCLSIAVDGGAGGGGTSATGGTGYCLGAPAGSSFGGYGGGVCLSVCLGMPYPDPEGGAGGTPQGGAGGEVDTAGAGPGGAGGEPPIFCLSAPFGGSPPIDADDGGESGHGGAG